MATVGDRVNGYTLLMVAAEAGQIGAVQKASSKESLPMVTAGGRNALMLAAAAGHAEIVELLQDLSVELHIVVEVPTRHPVGQLAPAAPAPAPDSDSVAGVDDDPIEMALQILPPERRKSMRATLTTMQPAARQVVLQKLLDAASPKTQPQPTQQPQIRPHAPLAEPPRAHRSRGLLAAVDEQGNTALHLAAYRGQVAVVELFMARGEPSLSSCNCEGMTALHFAAENGQAETVAALLCRGGGGGGLLEAVTHSGMTPLHKAARAGANDATILALLSSGAKPLLSIARAAVVTPDAGLNAFHLAASNGKTEALTVLGGALSDNQWLEVGAGDGRRLVHFAAGAGCVRQAFASLWSVLYGVHGTAYAL